MFALLILLDCVIVGMFAFYLAAVLFGNSPLSRLLKLLFGVVAGGFYFLLCIELNYGEMAMEASLATGAIVFFGPIALMAILCVIGYMFKDK